MVNYSKSSDYIPESTKYGRKNTFKMNKDSKESINLYEKFRKNSKNTLFEQREEERKKILMNFNLF